MGKYGNGQWRQHVRLLEPRRGSVSAWLAHQERGKELDREPDLDDKIGKVDGIPDGLEVRLDASGPLWIALGVGAWWRLVAGEKG